jgi:translation initiation factor 3 subunit C
LSILRQKVRKYNKDFETEIKKYQEEPDPLGYSSGALEDDDEELEVAQKTAVPAPSEKKAAKAKDDSDLEWGSESDGDSSDSDFDLEGKKMEELRQYFLK